MEGFSKSDIFTAGKYYTFYDEAFEHLDFDLDSIYIQLTERNAPDTSSGTLTTNKDRPIKLKPKITITYLALFCFMLLCQTFLILTVVLR